MADEPTIDSVDDGAEDITLKDFGDLIAKTVAATLDSLGLDKVDRKHAIFPTEADPNGDDLKALPVAERVKRLCKAITAGDDVTAKALSEGTAADGGYVVPTEFQAELIKRIETLGFLRGLVAVKTVGSDAGTYPAVSGGVTVYWTAENADITASQPSFKEIAYAIKKLAGLTPMSSEVLEDAAIDLYRELVDMFSIALGQEEDRVICNGIVGSGEPEGILTATGTTTLAQAGANLTADDLIGLYYDLPAVLRKARRANWLISPAAMELIEKLKDDNDRYLFRTAISADAPATILNLPFNEQDDLPTQADGNGLGRLILADLKSYYLFDRRRMTIKTSEDAYDAFQKDQVWLKVTERFDGRVMVPQAFCILTGVK